MRVYTSTSERHNALLPKESPQVPEQHEHFCDIIIVKENSIRSFHHHQFIMVSNHHHHLRQMENHPDPRRFRDHHHLTSIFGLPVHKNAQTCNKKNMQAGQTRVLKKTCKKENVRFSSCLKRSNKHFGQEEEKENSLQHHHLLFYVQSFLCNPHLPKSKNSRQKTYHMSRHFYRVSFFSHEKKEKNQARNLKSVKKSGELSCLSALFFSVTPCRSLTHALSFYLWVSLLGNNNVNMLWTLLLLHRRDVYCSIIIIRKNDDEDDHHDGNKWKRFLSLIVHAKTIYVHIRVYIFTWTKPKNHWWWWQSK